MIRYLCASLVTVALGLAATSVHADVSDERSERPVVFLDAGAASSIRELDQVGSKLGTGFSAGGGVGFPLNERLGLGFEYRLPHGFGLQVEGTGWVYDWDRYGLNRTQLDKEEAERAAWSAPGVSSVENRIAITV